MISKKTKNTNMDSSSGYLFGLVVGLLVHFIYTYIQRMPNRKKYSFPLGPKGDFYSDKKEKNTVVPIYLHLTKLKDKFGDIFTVEVAGKKVVVVTSDELFGEILLKKSVQFAGRNDPKRLKISFFNNESSFTADDSPR